MSRPTFEELLLAHIERVDTQGKELDKRLDSIEKVLVAQEINLKLHMKRSDALETIVLELKEKDIKPIQKHITMVEGVLKFLGILSLLLGLIAGFFEFFSRI